MSKEKKYLRFTISDRIEHWVQMASFTTLGLTGLIQKFAESNLAIRIISILGGIESVRIIHRIGAIGLMLGTIYHIGTAGYKYYVKRSRITMLPSLNDVKAAWGTFLYNLRLKKNKPQQGRYTFDEKFEYWAFIWGTIVMGLTGFMLWNPIATSKILPGVIIPAALAAHSGEALLAVLAIAIWHFYNVHIKHLNKSMFTGQISEHEMLEEHPLELADIKAGLAEIPQDPKIVAKRKRIFFPVYSLVAAILLVGVYFFVAGEETAIATIPRAEDVVIFAPFTPTPLPTPIPTPTPAPIPEGVTWNDGVAALFISKCGNCHAAAVLGGLDLSTYETALAGGGSGTGIIPGDPDNSNIVIKQRVGNHPGQLSEDELNTIIEWILNGAEKE
jgi:cytochrome b subunit of formate dehydrogenase